MQYIDVLSRLCAKYWHGSTSSAGNGRVGRLKNGWHCCSDARAEQQWVRAEAFEKRVTSNGRRETRGGCCEVRKPAWRGGFRFKTTGMDGPFLGMSGPGQGINGPFRGRNDPFRGRNGPVRGRNGPVRGRNGPVRRRNDPVLGRNGPVHGRNGPVRGRNGPVRGRNGSFRGLDQALRPRNGASLYKPCRI